MSQYELSNLAKADIADIWSYIAVNRSEEAADRVLDRITDNISLLSQMPGMGRSREEFRYGLRSYTSGNYLIFYIPILDGIRVWRILHGARNIDSSFFVEDEEDE